MTRPDAAAVAAAMNARPLPADTDGGLWVGTGVRFGNCDTCEGWLDVQPSVTNGTGNLCLPCAMADVQRAHAAADPHCTCPDCLESHTDREVNS